MEKGVIKVGKFNTMRIVRFVDFGAYLDGGTKGDILIPKRYLTDKLQVGDEVEAFVYYDSEDRIVATTDQPKAQVGQFAFLTVKTVSQYGAFLDWGLPKDLLVPYSEQRSRMEVDKSYVVYLYIDASSGRIAATEKYKKYHNNFAPQYSQGDEVEALICDRTQLGYKAIINNKHSGVIYNNQVFRRLSVGERCKAYISKVRDDDKIDLSLQPIGYDKVGDIKSVIIKRLKEHGGQMAVGDKTDPETIKYLFGCSKKTFKMTIGTLFRENVISISADRIKLL